MAPDDISLPHEDFVFAKLRLAQGCTDAPAGAVLRSKVDCNDFLHRVVAKLWTRLRERLRLLDRTDPLHKSLQLHEGALQDRDRWQRTAKAVLALHSASEDVFSIAQQRKENRSNVTLAARTLIEMAVCESRVGGGRILADWELDELLALTTLLIEVATDSDAIHSDLLEPAITLCHNGEYLIDRPFYQRVIQPFTAAYFSEGFRQAATDYEDLYRAQTADAARRLDETLSATFINAFAEEFRMTPDDLINALGGLIELAQSQNSVIVQTTIGDLRRILMERHLSPDISTAFLEGFALCHRPSWDEVPVGFRLKDISPWRYGRRLSVTARPLFAFGYEDADTVIYGLGTLRQSVAHILDRTESGQMPSDFFTTDAMRAYLGAVNHERGHAFAESVADALRKDGWQARTAVQMTELGAPPQYGDLDVLAWAGSGRVELIECKRLQLARTVAEIAEICRRFRGEARDELAKHLHRVNWIKDNPSSISRLTGVPVIAANIDARVITSVHVPMRYLESLPFPANRIGPMSTLPHR